MKTVSANTTNGKKRSGSHFVKFTSRRRYKFVPSQDLLQGIISILPSTMVDRDLSLFTARSFYDSLQGDWDRVGDDMWLSISKFASISSK